MTFLDKFNSATHIGKIFAHWHLVIAIIVRSLKVRIVTELTKASNFAQR